MRRRWERGPLGTPVPGRTSAYLPLVERGLRAALRAGRRLSNPMRSHLTICIFSLTLVAGCTDSGTDDVSQRNDVDEEECECKIEGADIGRVGAAVKPPGHTTIRFQSWIAKPGSPGEYIGFTL